MQNYAKFPSESLRAREKIPDVDGHIEIDVNTANTKITREYLAERLHSEAKIDFIDALNCITLRCIEQTEHGSKQSVRNYLDVLTCSDGKYRKFKENGRTYITKRVGQ